MKPLAAGPTGEAIRPGGNAPDRRHSPAVQSNVVAVSSFLHAADLHLGSQLKNLGDRVSPEIADAARNEVRRVFDDLVDTAISRAVEFVVLAGDVYDRAESDPGAMQRVNRGLRRLDDHGIRVFMVHGNHDPLAGAHLVARDRPGNIHVFPSGEVTTVPVELRNGVTATVAGVSFAKTAETENLARRFASVGGRPLIGVLHANVAGNGAHDNYAPCSVEDLVESPVNYWALGHIHDRRIEQTARGWWAYPGNLQGRSAKATECGPKGALIVGIDDAGSVLRPEFVALDRVRFHRLLVDTSSCGTAEQVWDEVDERIRADVEGAGSIIHLFRVELVGATGAHTELARPLGELFQDLSDHVEGSLRNGAITKLVNSTARPVDPAHLRSRETVLAASLAVLDGLELPGSLGELSVSLPAPVAKAMQSPDEAQVFRAEIERLLIDGLWAE